MKIICFSCSAIFFFFLFSLSEGTTFKCDTNAEIHNLEHVWTINCLDVLISAKENDDYRDIKSPIFWPPTNNAIKWYLQLEIDRSIGNNETFINLNLRPSWDSASDNIWLKQSVVILNSQQEEIWSGNENSFQRCTFKKSTSFNIAKSELLATNKVTIKYDITFALITHHESIPYSAISNNPENDLSKSFESLLGNEQFSDIKISIDGVVWYKAHKAVLAARSPVFAAIFKRYTQAGNELKQINITGIKTPVFYELLRYMYTGKCINREQLTTDLLVAADKYELSGLKLMCGKTLQKSLTIKNAADIVVLADDYDVRTLKLETIEFIVNNFAEVSKTVGWKSMVISDSKLIDEVCKALFNKHSSCDKHEIRKYCSC